MMAEIISNIRNLDKMKKIFADYMPDIVFHHAAQSLGLGKGPYYSR
jgi:FlaA1/EpsC-like NDP-sugar epimerase